VFDEIINRTFRVLMADVGELLELSKKNPDVVGKTAYILEAELPLAPPDAMFVGAVSVPTLLEAFGGAASGPVGFAFLVREGCSTVKRYFISISSNSPWGLPPEITPVPLGVTSIGGVLYGHFELEAPTKVMQQFLTTVQETAKAAGLSILLLKAKDYTPEGMKELLSTLARSLHGAR
jgi:hypothetical protein